MNIAQKIVHNTAIQLAGKIISTLLGLVAVSIMTRYLGVEKFGWYSTASGFLMFTAIISDFGFVAVTASMLSQFENQKNRLFDCLFTWRFITSLVLNSTAILVIMFLPYPFEVKMATAILSASFFFMSLTQVFIGRCQSELKMINQAIGEILGRILLVVGLALMVFYNQNFLYLMTVVSLASALYALYLWLKAGGAKFCFDRDLSQNIFKKMWPVATAVIFNAIYLQGDKVILPLFVSQAQMGLYGAAYRVVDLVAQTSAMVMGIMMPLISYAFVQELKEKFNQYLQTSFDLVSLIVLPMSAGLIALAVPIMVLIAGPQFAYAGIILQLLSLVVLGIVFGMVFGYTAIAINRQNKTMWIFISCAVLSLAGYLIFIPLYGIWGAVGVSIFSEFYAGFGLMKVSLYYARTKISFKPFFKILFSSLLMGLAVYFIDLNNLFLSIVLGIILYAGLILTLQAVPIQTIRQTLLTPKDVPPT